MNLKPVDQVPPNSTVILRLDLDLPMLDGKIIDNHRLLKSLSTINKLLTANCQLIIIGHMARPEGRDEKYSLKPVYLELMSLLSNSNQSLFLEELENIDTVKLSLSQNQIIFVENLRFWSGESENNNLFLKPLIDQSQVFVNDAIAVAHRPSASVLLHQCLPAFYGDNFIEEINNLQKILLSSHPKTLILGGAKSDKLDYLSELANLFDNICIGGKLPQYCNQSALQTQNIFVSTLTADTFDIDQNSINHIKDLIDYSQTVVWSGAMGFFENPTSKIGTIEIANSLAQSAASYKVIAGGDTLSSIKELNLLDKIDFVSSGGGVLLEFLAKGKLPAW